MRRALFTAGGKRMTDNTPQALTAAMLRKTLFVVTTMPARGPGIAEVLPEHLAYQVALEREGRLFGAGPLFEPDSDIPSGGMIILRAADLAEAKVLADRDPFHAKGLRSYTVSRWMLNEGGMTFTVRFSDQSVLID